MVTLFLLTGCFSVDCEGGAVSENAVNKESFMLACLKMARAYIGTVEAEIRLYNGTNGSVPVNPSFQALKDELNEKISDHKHRLEDAQNGKTRTKKKKRLLKRRVLR